MKAIVRDMPEAWLEERRRRGQDRYDEMWEGVLHVNPIPSNPHQDLRDDLLAALRRIGASHDASGDWRTERNLAKPGGWPEDYRIPDLVYLAGETAAVDRGTHWEGPPEIIVEIAGEHDESRAKLPWYAELGVREAWIVEVDSRQPEILIRSGEEWLKQRPDEDGWFASEAFPVELRRSGPDDEPSLEIRRPGEARPDAAI